MSLESYVPVSNVCRYILSYLQGLPESLDNDVIPETPFAVHAVFDVSGLEYGCECFAGKLTPLVGMKNIGLHTQFIGEIIDIKADEDVFSKDKQLDIMKIKPLLMTPPTRDTMASVLF